MGSDGSVGRGDKTQRPVDAQRRGVVPGQVHLAQLGLQDQPVEGRTHFVGNNRHEVVTHAHRLFQLGLGGLQLYKAEVAGPMKDVKLTPRIAETAKALWFIYLLLTSLCALAYWMAGMTLFDAICHSFSTLSVKALASAAVLGLMAVS